MLELLLILQAMDVVTTVIGLRREGVSEGHPVARWLFKYLEPLPTMIVAKVIVCTMFVLFQRAYPSWWPVTGLYCAFLCWIVWRNVKVIRSVA